MKEIERKDEEEWALKDVVFVEDNKVLPVGKVIKVSQGTRGQVGFDRRKKGC